jgi:hypothetical protein
MKRLRWVGAHGMKEAPSGEYLLRVEVASTAQTCIDLLGRMDSRDIDQVEKTRTAVRTLLEQVPGVKHEP